MKKTLTIILAALLILGALILAYEAGRQHAILTAEMFVVDLPDRNSFGGFDEDEITVYLIVDDEVHEYGAWIG